MNNNMNNNKINEITSLFTDLSKQGLEKSDSILEFKNQIFESCASFKYGIGGLNLPARGYFCPSIVMDIVAGNCSRGRLVRKPRITTIPDFVFGFTQEGRLVYVESWYNSQKISAEYIIYEKSVVTGFSFTNDNVLVSYTHEQYINNQLSEYSVVFFDKMFGTAYGLHNETYSIGVDHMIAGVFDYIPKNELFPCSFNSDYYFFNIDNHGYLTSYYPTQNGIDTIDKRVYKIDKIKRQIYFK
jgi:hypothetical protein